MTNSISGVAQGQGWLQRSIREFDGVTIEFCILNEELYIFQESVSCTFTRGEVYFLWSIPQQNYVSKVFASRSRCLPQLAKGTDEIRKIMHVVMLWKGVHDWGTYERICLQNLGYGGWSTNINGIFSFPVPLRRRI